MRMITVRGRCGNRGIAEKSTTEVQATGHSRFDLEGGSRNIAKWEIFW